MLAGLHYRPILAPAATLSSRCNRCISTQSTTSQRYPVRTPTDDQRTQRSGVYDYESGRRPGHTRRAEGFRPRSRASLKTPTPPPIRYRITSILLNPDTVPDKKAVRYAIQMRSQKGPWSHNLNPFSAALVLATPGLTSWLDDREFMASLLHMTGRDGTNRVTDPVSSKGISVLSGVVDGLLPPVEMEDAVSKTLRLDAMTGKKRLATPQGFAVVQGYERELLPGLWGDATSMKKAWDDVDGRAGLVFRLPGLNAWANPLMDVTVPVANTVFENGRVSTLFASRWEGASWAQMRETRRMNLASQVVRVPGFSSTDVKAVSSGAANDARIPGKPLSVKVACPLVAITPLWTVGTALGNILKTFDVDRETVPASRRLEEVVPKLLESRRRMGLPDIRGPLSVWALVVPAGFEAASVPVPEELGALMYPRRLLAAGCRLHRVLSGGGGWGAKQGLLSLDPETRFVTTEKENIESFERDFLAGQEGGSGGGSVIGPGDKVVFCVDEATYPRPSRVLLGNERRKIGDLKRPFVLRVRPEETGEEEGGSAAIPAWDGNEVRKFEGSFGVVAKSLFLAPAGTGPNDGPGMADGVKIDIPGAELSVREVKPMTEDKRIGYFDLRGDSVKWARETAAQLGAALPGSEPQPETDGEPADGGDSYPPSIRKAGQDAPSPDFDDFIRNSEDKWAGFLEKMEDKAGRANAHGRRRQPQSEDGASATTGSETEALIEQILSSKRVLGRK